MWMIVVLKIFVFHSERAIEAKQVKKRAPAADIWQFICDNVKEIKYNIHPEC